MIPLSLGQFEIVPGARRSAACKYLDFSDSFAAVAFLRRFKMDCLMMLQMRKVLSKDDAFLFRRNDDEVIQILASQFVSGRLLVVDQDHGWSPGSAVGQGTESDWSPALQKSMSGYFTMMKFVLRAKSSDQLEDILGYRKGRLSTKGFLIYRFLRVPEITEFEVAGSSVTPADTWNAEDRKVRETQLAEVAPYHRNTRVPSFDEYQRRNARTTMAVEGDNSLVKVYPRDEQPNETYPPGHGIPQWRLTDDVKKKGSLTGALLFKVAPGASLPWIE